MARSLSDYLTEPETKIINTWDIIITPFLTMRQDAARQPHTDDQHGPDHKPGLHVVEYGWRPPMIFVLSGLRAIVEALTEERSCFVTAQVHELEAEVFWDLPYPLNQATDGIMLGGVYDRDELWAAMARSDLTDWHIAETFRVSLNQVKPTRYVRDTLIEIEANLPDSWPEALREMAKRVPERLTRDLAEEVNELGYR